MKYGGVVVFIGYDPAEIWGFRYGLTLVIGTLKIMDSTGVFVRVVCAIRHSIKNFPSVKSNISTLIKHKQSHSRQKMGSERDFYEGRQRTKQAERQPRIVVKL
jgi:hypothetical protein